MTVATLAALDQCDRELARIRAEVENGTKQPTWLVVMGELDWQVEKLLIKAEAAS